MMSKNETITPDTTLDIVSHSAAQTERLGARLAELLSSGDVVLLEGPLGGGKTLLTHGIAEGLGIDEYVTSPSFTLINEYRPKDTGARLPLFHIDLYRLGDVVREADGIGMDEYLNGAGIAVVEWADRAPDIMPPEHLLVRMSIVSETKRGIFMIPHGEHYQDVLREFKRRAFGV
jgi:tRNA threonylcarbamoyladenosine biosynthesis protein TsaE